MEGQKQLILLGAETNHGKIHLEDHRKKERLDVRIQFRFTVADRCKNRTGNKNRNSGKRQKNIIANELAKLFIKVKDLDPSPIDFTKIGPLGNLFNPVRRYFHKYKTADAEIATIMKSLEKGQKGE